MIITSDIRHKYKLTAKTVDKLESIDLEEFVKFWKVHNDDEICEHYNLSSNSYKKFCDINHIVKTRERFIYLQERSREAKYGDKHYRNTAKAFNTKLERYGDKNYHNKLKAMQTCMEKYGRPFGFDYEKSKKTCLDKYGVEICSKSQVVKDKFKQTCLDKYGVEAPTQLSSIRSKSHCKYYLDGLYFDSGWEVAYYIWLRDNNIEFEYHPKEIIYYFNDSMRTYQPDFIVNNQIIEIKSEVLLEELMFADEASQAHYKWECMVKNNVRVITRPEILFYTDFVESAYWKEYIHSLKVENRQVRSND